MNLYEEEYPDRHVAYSAALLFQQAGLIEEALDAFSVSIGTEFYTALPFYSRGQLRAELGDAIGAAQDFYTFFEVRARSELTAFEALSVPRVTLDDLMPESERMIQYELMRSSYSPGGEYVSYQFGRPGHAVEISKSEDGHIISALEVMYSRNYPRLLFFECLDGVCQRSLAYQNTSGFLSGYGDDRTTLTINDEYIEVYKKFFGFESGSDELAILVPEAQPDPRPSVPCEDGAFPLFQIGDGITTTLKVWPVFDVRVAPDVNSAVVPEDSEGRNGYLQIAGDLTCGPGGNWWPVAVDGEMVGWIGDTEGWEFYSAVPSQWYPLRTVAELLALQWPGTRSAAVASPGTPSATVAPTATLSVQVSTLAHTPTVSGIETSTQSAPATAVPTSLAMAAASEDCTYTIPPGDTQALKDSLAQASTADEPTIICLSADSIYTFRESRYPLGSISALSSVDGQDITIQGNHATLERAGGTGAFRLLNVSKGSTVNLVNIVIRGGEATWGGAIQNQGTLTLTNSTLTENLATGFGGAIQNTGTLTISNSSLAGNVATGAGGAIYNTGNLTVRSSEISSNISGVEGGGLANADLEASATIEASMILSNRSGSGGAILNDGSLQITDSVLYYNVAEDGGGMLSNRFGEAWVSNSCMMFNADTLTRANDILTRAGYEVDASGNWWGTNSGPAVGSIGGDVIADVTITSQPGWCTRDAIGPLPELPPPLGEVTPSPPIFEGVCPRNLPSRLIDAVYDLATTQAEADLPPLGVRSAPTLAAEQTGTVPSETPIQLSDGPICSNGYTWWQIDLGDDRYGWVTEADSDQYWLVPAQPPCCG
jgi:hypothetical protein